MKSNKLSLRSGVNKTDDFPCVPLWPSLTFLLQRPSPFLAL